MGVWGDIRRRANGDTVRMEDKEYNEENLWRSVPPEYDLIIKNLEYENENERLRERLAKLRRDMSRYYPYY